MQHEQNRSSTGQKTNPGPAERPTTIRPVTPNDLPALMALIEAIGLFPPEEIDEMRTLLTDYFEGRLGPDHVWITDEENGLAGAAYYAPERMTEGTWNLYFMGIHPDRRREGRASALLRYVEENLAARGERLLLVETSGHEAFARAWALYHKNGFEQEARIRDFYAAGSDKIVFRKALTVNSRLL